MTELSCPGYVIDDAQRIIQLKANEDVEFVFTNSKLPSLHLLKVDSKGNPVRNWKQKLLTWEKFDVPKQVEDDPYAKYEKLYPNDPFCGR